MGIVCGPTEKREVRNLSNNNKNSNDPITSNNNGMKESREIGSNII
jgi:hypothetical protein